MIDPDVATVNLLVGENKVGKPIFEEVPVEPVDGSAGVRVLATPGMVLNIAAGDVIELNPADGTFTTLTRGGNVGAHVFAEHAVVDRYIEEIEAAGGRLDGRADGLSTFTVPYGPGVVALEGIFNQMVEADSEVEWYFSNVFADDGTPLNWWL
ncbi:DUF4265 domain-containing protein [Lentzea sp. JNUCC 0626]|uniref:DUF4265 domain-containing protein n=1 Tax=Lentzea sp. JNUCC 0626 TaxID=3367513 RepID=UPI00374A1AC3